MSVKATEHPWGKRWLMCPPTHFDVTYAINPWMDPNTKVNRSLALAQWEQVRGALLWAGATVSTLDPAKAEESPDLIYAANAGVVSCSNNGIPDRVILASFRYQERREERSHNEGWFRTNPSSNGKPFEICHLPRGMNQEGLADAMPVVTNRGVEIIAGYGAFPETISRSMLASFASISRLVAAPITAVALRDSRFYHLDTALLPLPGGHGLAVRSAFSNNDLKTIGRLIPDLLVLDESEAVTFCCNSLVVGSTVIMPGVPYRVRQQFEKWGLNIVEVDVGEILKGGGGPRCMALPLDTQLGHEFRPLNPDLAHSMV